MKNAFITFLLSFAAVFCASSALAADPQYGEYIDLPGATSAADPHVIEWQGVYYLYPTTTGVSIECWSSTDLETWDYEGVVWQPADPDGWNTRDVWAPGLYEEDGTFYLYYTADDQIGVATADSPTGPFTDVYDHPLIGGGYGGSWFKAIDAFVFRDDDGQRYLYATGYAPFSFLRVFTMPDPVTVDEDWTQVTYPDIFSWEMFVNEGPWLLKHDGTYYLMYSGNGADEPWYALGYATAASPLGPFTKFAGNPILHSDSRYEFWGPGHHSVVTGPEGDLWMFYHTKLRPRKEWDRRLRKNKIAFTDSGVLTVDLGLGAPSDDDSDDDDATDDDTDNDSADDDSGDDDSDDDDLEVPGDPVWDEGDHDDGCCG